MDRQTRELIGGAPFGRALNRKIAAVRQALIDQNVDPPAHPLVVYVGGERVEMAWSGEGPTGVVRARIGDEGDDDAVQFTLPAPWVLGADPTDDDVNYLLARNRAGA